MPEHSHGRAHANGVLELIFLKAKGSDKKKEINIHNYANTAWEEIADSLYIMLHSWRCWMQYSY